MVPVTGPRLALRAEAALCLLSFLLLSPLLAWIPISALAGILLVVAFRMVDWNAFRLLKHRETRLDFAVIAAVVIGVAWFGWVRVPQLLRTLQSSGCGRARRRRSGTTWPNTIAGCAGKPTYRSPQVPCVWLNVPVSGRSRPPAFLLPTNRSRPWNR